MLQTSEHYTEIQQRPGSRKIDKSLRGQVRPSWSSTPDRLQRQLCGGIRRRGHK